MALTPHKRNYRRGYDWNLFRETCMASPGEWFREDDPDRPTTNATQIRNGTPKVFEPAGAFDADYSKSEGTFIRYVGVPIEPWAPWMGDDRSFADVVRTFDPSAFPADTPRTIVALAEAHTLKHLRKLGPHTIADLDRHLTDRKD